MYGLVWFFGITHKVYRIFLRSSRGILVTVRSKFDLERVGMTSLEEINLQKVITWQHFSMLGTVYDVSDLLKLILEQSGCTVIKEMFIPTGRTTNVSEIYLFYTVSKILIA